MYFLENDFIGLRELAEADAYGNYADWFNDPEVCRYNSHHKFPMYKDEILEFIQGLSKNHSELVLAVDEKTSQKHIGNISLQRIDLLNRQAEIAFMFGDKCSWGKGYATMAAKLMIDHAFKELGLNRIYFGTADNNIGMQKVGNKLNFRKGGVRRQAIYKDGNYHDIYDYDLLKYEWERSMK